MSVKNPTLLVLRLEGPLQSWGLRARWDYRDTSTEPSKS
ncbi:MAG: CRISPR-associated protein Cas5, partial [Candidatus Thorarchaeota archaeon]